MTHPNSPQSEFLRGIKECSPMLIGLLPWALILGVQGGQKGMSWLEMLLMTGMNFAGGSEFAAVNLWANPLPILIIATVTFMINSRHILMGAAIAPYMRDMPLKKAMPALFFMCDESWALAFAEIQKRKAKKPIRRVEYVTASILANSRNDCQDSKSFIPSHPKDRRQAGRKSHPSAHTNARPPTNKSRTPQSG